MMEQEKKYLSDILSSILLIEKFTADVNQFQDFVSDDKTRSAVERQISIIGEACVKLQKINTEMKFQEMHKIIGLRNRIVHSYDNIDPSIIWAIIKNHLPELKKHTNQLLEN